MRETTAAAPAPTTTVTFTEQVGDVLNPEGDWWRETAIGGSFGPIHDPIDPVATPPTTITLIKMNLDALEAEIPLSRLDALAFGLACDFMVERSWPTTIEVE